ncbi:MAG TPA: hypothetical protein DEG63_09180 [Flavobacteriaceae bacterium]|nr:hypothetical protein [Flavobacteriaceae bacterium]
MKNKIGFNIIFALIAFPIGLALLREFNFQDFTFKNTALGIIYSVTFIFCIFFMLKKKKVEN